MTSVHRTTCNRDCPDTCSLLVTVEDGRAVRLAGDPADPVTRGFLCERTTRFLERQYSPDRFTTPLRRQGEGWQSLSWDDALDLAASRLQEARERHGPASILHYRSGGSLGILKGFASHLFQAFGPVTTKRGDICSGAGEAAQVTDFGVSDSHDLDDLRHSQVILLWGKNPHVSGVHLLPVLQEARRRGAVLVGIDPVRHRAAGLCEVFLQPRPGGDFALAMAFARWLFDHAAVDPAAPEYCDHFDAYRNLVQQKTFEQWAAESGVSVAEAEVAASLYGSRAPGAIQVGWGMGRRRYGSASVRAVDALGAVRGNLGVPGGGVSYYFHRRGAFDQDFLDHEPPRTLAEARLGAGIQEARDPPIDVVWVTAGNPVSMLPDATATRRALAERFTVVVDTHPTDTTDVADLILPTCTLLEDEDVLGAYGNHYLRCSRPSVAAPEGVRHEFGILQGLAQRLGVADALPATIEEACRRVTRRLHEAGVTLERLAEGPVHNPFAPAVLFADRRFPTPSGRVNLLTEAPPSEAPDPASLRLMAVSHSQAQSSQWTEALSRAPLTARVHPDSAQGMADGDPAWVGNARGRLAVTLQHDRQVHPQVVLMPKGGMLRDERCANLLIPAEETDAGGGAVYYDEPVQLHARADAPDKGTP